MAVPAPPAVGHPVADARHQGVALVRKFEHVQRHLGGKIKGMAAETGEAEHVLVRSVRSHAIRGQLEHARRQVSAVTPAPVIKPGLLDIAHQLAHGEHVNVFPRFLAEKIGRKPTGSGPATESFMRTRYAAGRHPLLLHQFFQGLASHGGCLGWVFEVAGIILSLFIDKLLGHLDVGRDVLAFADRTNDQAAERLGGPGQAKPAGWRKILLLVGKLAVDVQRGPRSLVDDLERRGTVFVNDGGT